MSHKILRTANAPTTPPDETELNVAQAIVDLENNVPELKVELRPLHISAAREVDVRGGKKAIVVFIPVPQLKAFRKVQPRCVQSVDLIWMLTIGSSFLHCEGSPGSWRRSSQIVMSFSLLSAGCYPSPRAPPASSKNVLGVEPLPTSTNGSLRTSSILLRSPARGPGLPWTDQNC